ncbi:hypothetical protein B0T10DRAFT_361046, partial [Thelonectria olida]
FDDSWRAWSENVNQDGVLRWFADFSEKLAAFVEDHRSIPTRQQGLSAKANDPVDGSVGKRKMDIGFVNDPEARRGSKC